MSLQVQISFKALKHADAWDSVGELLQQGSVGAKLQNAFEIFGEDVSNQLEELLEEFPSELLWASFYERSDDHITLEFEWPSGELELPEALKALLANCAVESLQCKALDLSGD